MSKWQRLAQKEKGKVEDRKADPMIRLSALAAFRPSPKLPQEIMSFLTSTSP
jgi:hypothetical protein